MSLVARITALAQAVAARFRQIAPSSPTLTWTDGEVTRVDYANGDHKLLTWDGGRLSQVDHFMPGRTVRTVLNYDAQGRPMGATETVI